MHTQTPQSFIPPTLSAGIALHLAPQGHRAWPQTSYWLLTVVEWSVHIPTLIHYVQKTQQRKTVVWECLEVCGQQWVSAVSLLNLSSSHPFDCPVCKTQQHGNSWTQTQTDVCGMSLDLKREDEKKKKRGHLSLYMHPPFHWDECNFPSLLCDRLWQAGRWWSDGDVRRPRPLWCWVAVTLELPSAEKVSC